MNMKNQNLIKNSFQPGRKMLARMLPVAAAALWAVSSMAAAPAQLENISVDEFASAAENIDSDALVSAPASFMSLGTNVKSITLNNLGDYTGRNLTAFYVSGRAPVISTGDDTIIVRSIKTSPVTVRIDSSGTAVIPPVTVPRSGFDAFNAIVFVVHSSPAVYLKNPDGSAPADPRSPNGGLPDSAYNYDKKWSIQIQDVDTSQPLILRSR
ncbi:MAG: hypothetical protein H7222_02790 [Methylotenera sp.]|nr:hypothetical protein [Oligoflexia bacterium]